LDVRLGIKDTGEAIAILEELLGDRSVDAERAAVHYCIWLLDPERDESRSIASDLYRALYESAPNVEYWRRYETLTGERLPQPEVRTQVAETMEHIAVDLESVFQEAETLARTDELTPRPFASAAQV
jgi:hypothetical protein